MDCALPCASFPILLLATPLFSESNGPAGTVAATQAATHPLFRHSQGRSGCDPALERGVDRRPLPVARDRPLDPDLDLVAVDLQRPELVVERRLLLEPPVDPGRGPPSPPGESAGRPLC